MHWKNSGIHPFDYRGGSTFKWWYWLLSVVAIRDRNWLLGKNVHYFHWFDIDLGSKSYCLLPYNRSQSLYKLTYLQSELEKLISKNMEADEEWEEPKNLMRVRWIALFPASFSVSQALFLQYERRTHYIQSKTNERLSGYGKNTMEVKGIKDSQQKEP